MFRIKGNNIKLFLIRRPTVLLGGWGEVFDSLCGTWESWRWPKRLD